MFYTKYILRGLVGVLGIMIYLRYDNIGDILIQNVATLVYVQFIVWAAVRLMLLYYATLLI